MRRRWPILAVAIGASACTYGHALTTASPPPPPEPPTTTAPVPDFDAQAFLGDHFGDLVEGEPALVVILPKTNSFDLERGLNTLPEVTGYAFEYLIPFAASHGVEAPADDFVAVGLWAAYEDTDIQLWIDYLDDRFGVLAAGRGAQEFIRLDSIDDWQPLVTIEGPSSEFWLVGSDERAMLVDSESAWLIHRDGTTEQVGHPPNWTTDNFYLAAAGSRFVAFADGEDPKIFEAGAWQPAEPLLSGERLFGTAYADGRFFAVTGPGRNGGDAGSIFELNLKSGEWRQLSAVPERINVGDVVASENRIIVSGTRQDGNNLMRGDTQPGVHVFNVDTATWATLPDAPINGQAASIGSMGAYLLAWNYDMQWSLLPSYGDHPWSRPGTVPLDQMECYPRTHSGDEFVVANFCEQLAMFADGAWSVIPRPPGQISVTDTGIWNAYESNRQQIDITYFDFLKAGYLGDVVP